MKQTVFLCALLVVAVGGWALHDPGDGAPLLPDPGYELGSHARLFYDLGDLDAMLQYAARYDSDREAFAHGLMMGGYYRLHENVKAGAFYQLRFGERHDEDWIEEGTSWIWRDTSTRPEHSLSVDLTPRVLLDFLPGRDWVFALKSRYGITMFEQTQPVLMQTLLVRPGLTWFWIRDREPVLNVSLQYAAYLSLDFGETWWYKRGPYASLVYSVTPDLMVDLNVGLQEIYWTESEDFNAAWPNNGYSQQVWRPWAVEAGVIYRMR